MNQLSVKKKRKGISEAFQEEKIWKAIRKSASRVMVNLSDQDCKRVSDLVQTKIHKPTVTVEELHNIVEVCLSECGFKDVSESYQNYRNYKEDSIKIFEAVDNKTLELQYKSDRSNANSDSSLITTKKAIISAEEQKGRYKSIFLGPRERKAIEEGYLYIHDIGSRLLAFNCDLVNVGRIMKGGFKLLTGEYTEPKSLSTAITVAKDILQAVGSQQYGGCTWPQCDEDLEMYAIKSYNMYCSEYTEICHSIGQEPDPDKMDKYAEKKVRDEARQGFQTIEMAFNTLSSSRGDLLFVTLTFGHSTGKWAKILSEELLKTRMKGQGKEGHEVPVVFPKLVFLYDSELHGVGKENEDLFKLACKSVQECQYPDFLSLDVAGEGTNYVGNVYHEHGKIISPMGCVSGKETVSYSINNIHYQSSPIEDMWTKIIELVNEPKPQHGDEDENLIIDLNDGDVKIYDNKLDKQVKVKYIIRNINPKWYCVKIGCYHQIQVTDNHPFETENRGVVLAKDLKIGEDIILISSSGELYPSIVSDCEPIDSDEEYSYDVTTESEHFEVSGIYSHNCRAFLSPAYKKGIIQQDGPDDEFLIYRCNLGVVSMNLPMIYQKSVRDGKDFHEILDYYMEMIRNLSKRTISYLSKFKASSDPLLFMEGGLDGGTLGETDSIGGVLKYSTISYGYGGLNELNVLATGKTMVEDQSFPLETMEYINSKIQDYKKKDNVLYALYGTPGESWLILAREQFIKEFGEFPGVTDHEYFSNSFHCPVYSDITPIEKMDIEKQFWNIPNGGKIMYGLVNTVDNPQGVIDLIRRAMWNGLYYGVNQTRDYCRSCGNRFIADDSKEDGDICPECGSDNVDAIRRMNGYLSFKKIGKSKNSRYSDGKLSEFKDRKSM